MLHESGFKLSTNNKSFYSGPLQELLRNVSSAGERYQASQAHNCFGAGATIAETHTGAPGSSDHCANNFISNGMSLQKMWSDLLWMELKEGK